MAASMHTAVRRLAVVTGSACAAMLIKLVPHHEGEVLSGYLDPIGIVTACYGHTRTAQMRSYTREECLQHLVDDLIEANRTVDRCVTYPLNAYNRAAFVSFSYNVGPGREGVKDGFCVLRNGNTPTHLRRANAGDMDGACEAMTAWKYAGGRVFAGLVRRRADEVAVCTGNMSDVFVLRGMHHVDLITFEVE